MRLVGIAVLTLVVFAAVAVLVQRSEVLFDAVTRKAAIDGRAVHELVTGSAQIPETISGDAGYVDYGVQQFDQWTAVAGFLTEQRFFITLPRQTRFSAAVLEIYVTASLEDQTTGRLQFDVGGKRRGEIVLEPGQNKMLVRIPLEPLDMERDWVEVDVTIKGNNPKAECATDWDGGVVVEIEPQTYMRVALEEPITRTLDKLLASGVPIRVIWPSQSDAPQTDNQISWRWPRVVARATFVPSTLARETDAVVSLEEIFALHKWRMEADSFSKQLNAQSRDWPIPILGQSGSASSREFRNRANWVYRYSRAKLPNWDFPDTLDLEMGMVSTEQNANWLLVVFLNGQIIYGETLPTSQKEFRKSINLPIPAQGVENTLRIALLSDEKKEGRCVEGRPAAARIGPATQIYRTAPASEPAFAGLLAKMPEKIDFFVLPQITAREMNFGFVALSETMRDLEVVHQSEQFDPQTFDGPSLELVGQDRLLAAVENYEAAGVDFWVVYARIGDGPVPEIAAFRSDEKLLRATLDLDNPVSALLIVPERDAP